MSNNSEKPKQVNLLDTSPELRESLERLKKAAEENQPPHLGLADVNRAGEALARAEMLAQKLHEPYRSLGAAAEAASLAARAAAPFSQLDAITRDMKVFGQDGLSTSLKYAQAASERLPDGTRVFGDQAAS